MASSVSSPSANKWTVGSFFAGVGGIELGFEQTGEFRVVYSNEYDKNAQKTYKLNFPEVHLDKRDIHEVSSDEVPNIDVITGGFPCQAFSIAGYRRGFEDERGDLFFELLRIITHKKPRAIFIENVKNMVTHDHGNTFKIICDALVTNGYNIKWKVMNTKDYGNVPQNRERIYIVGFHDISSYNSFSFPTESKLTTGLRSVIDFEGKYDDALYYKRGKQPFYDKLAQSVKDKESIYQWRRQYVRENKSGVVPTLTANMGTGGHNVPIILSDHGIRKLTTKEVFNVQGFPDSYILPVDMANSHLYKQAGNSVSVPVIKRIANQISKALKESSLRSFEKNNQAKYAIVYKEMYGRYSGSSHIIEQLRSIEEVNRFKMAHPNIGPFLCDKEYNKLVKKDISEKFYSVVKL